MRPKAWLILCILLVAVNAVFSLWGRQWRFDSIVLHHSAGSVGDYRRIRAMHLKRGWSDAAYHLILSNGSTEVVAGTLEPTGHFESLRVSGATRNQLANSRSIHLCVVGDYERDPFPPELRAPLANAVAELMREFSLPPDALVMHSDVGNTACPGRHLTREAVLGWMKTEAEALPDALEAQHREVIESSSLTLASYPRGLLMLQACASLVVVVLWLGLLRLVRKRDPRASRAHARSRPVHGRTGSMGRARGSSRKVKTAHRAPRGKVRKNRRR